MGETFWGLNPSEILLIDFDELPGLIYNWSRMDEVAVVEYVTRIRQNTRNDEVRLACNRIISAMINGPDVMDVNQ